MRKTKRGNMGRMLAVFVAFLMTVTSFPLTALARQVTPPVGETGWQRVWDIDFTRLHVDGAEPAYNNNIANTGQSNRALGNNISNPPYRPGVRMNNAAMVSPGALSFNAANNTILWTVVQGANYRALYVLTSGTSAARRDGDSFAPVAGRQYRVVFDASVDVGSVEGEVRLNGGAARPTGHDRFTLNQTPQTITREWTIPSTGAPAAMGVGIYHRNNNAANNGSVISITNLRIYEYVQSLEQAVAAATAAVTGSAATALSATLTNANAEDNLLAAVRSAITNPGITANWATNLGEQVTIGSASVIVPTPNPTVTPATLQGPGSITGVIRISGSPAEYIQVTVAIPQLASAGNDPCCEFEWIIGALPHGTGVTSIDGGGATATNRSNIVRMDLDIPDEVIPFIQNTANPITLTIGANTALRNSNRRIVMWTDLSVGTLGEDIETVAFLTAANQSATGFSRLVQRFNRHDGTVNSSQVAPDWANTDNNRAPSNNVSMSVPRGLVYNGARTAQAIYFMVTIDTNDFTAGNVRGDENYRIETMSLSIGGVANCPVCSTDPVVNQYGTAVTWEYAHGTRVGLSTTQQLGAIRFEIPAAVRANLAAATAANLSFNFQPATGDRRMVAWTNTSMAEPENLSTLPADTATGTAIVASTPRINDVYDASLAIPTSFLTATTTHIYVAKTTNNPNASAPANHRANELDRITNMTLALTVPAPTGEEVILYCIRADANFTEANFGGTGTMTDGQQTMFPFIRRNSAIMPGGHPTNPGQAMTFAVTGVGDVTTLTIGPRGGRNQGIHFRMGTQPRAGHTYEFRVAGRLGDTDGNSARIIIGTSSSGTDVVNTVTTAGGNFSLVGTRTAAQLTYGDVFAVGSGNTAGSGAGNTGNNLPFTITNFQVVRLCPPGCDECGAGPELITSLSYSITISGLENDTPLAFTNFQPRQNNATGGTVSTGNQSFATPALGNGTHTVTPTQLQQPWVGFQGLGYIAVIDGATVRLNSITINGEVLTPTGSWPVVNSAGTQWQLPNVFNLGDAVDRIVAVNADGSAWLSRVADFQGFALTQTRTMLMFHTGPPGSAPGFIPERTLITSIEYVLDIEYIQDPLNTEATLEFSNVEVRVNAPGGAMGSPANSVLNISAGDDTYRLRPITGAGLAEPPNGPWAGIQSFGRVVEIPGSNIEVTLTAVYLNEIRLNFRQPRTALAEGTTGERDLVNIFNSGDAGIVLAWSADGSAWLTRVAASGDFDIPNAANPTRNIMMLYIGLPGSAPGFHDVVFCDYCHMPEDECICLEIDRTLNPAMVGPFVITNPYAGVTWDTYYQFRAALHVHTSRTDSSGIFRDVVVDHYNKGFDILAITDHNVICTGDWAAPPPGANPRNWDWWATPIGIWNHTMPASERDAIIAGTFAGPFPTASRFSSEGQNWRATVQNTMGLRRPSGNSGMIPVPFGNEQTYTVNMHMVTLWANFTNRPYNQYDPFNGCMFARGEWATLRRTQEYGGVIFHSHPGRTSRATWPGGLRPRYGSIPGNARGMEGGAAGAAASNNPLEVNRMLEFYRTFSALVGMELYNRADNETRSDRILWDNLLMELMPEGRNVWGFGKDDSHGLNQTGHSWSVMLMPYLDGEDTLERTIRSGAHYTVSRVDRRLGVNHMLGTGAIAADGTSTPGSTSGDLFNPLFNHTVPVITGITATNTTITIEYENACEVVWFTGNAARMGVGGAPPDLTQGGGTVIHIGPTLDITTLGRYVWGNYVRAAIICRDPATTEGGINSGGVALTQPFGIFTESGGTPPPFQFPNLNTSDHPLLGPLAPNNIRPLTSTGPGAQRAAAWANLNRVVDGHPSQAGMGAISHIIRDGGTPIDELNLPTSGWVETERNWGYIIEHIEWDLENIDYDPENRAAQTFVVTGTFTLPNDHLGNPIGNPQGFPLTIDLTVNVLRTVPPPLHIAQLGQNWYFYGRRNTEFLDDALNPAVFTTWNNGTSAPAPFTFASQRRGATGGTIIPYGPGPWGSGAAASATGPANNHTFTYFSSTFYIPDDFDIDAVTSIVGRHFTDDALILFVNGTEVYRFNVVQPPGSWADPAPVEIGADIDWNAFVGINWNPAHGAMISFDLNSNFTNVPTTGTGGSDVGNAVLRHAGSGTNLRNAIQPGANVITAVVGQNSGSSSDLCFDLELRFIMDDHVATDLWSLRTDEYIQGLAGGTVTTLAGSPYVRPAHAGTTITALSDEDGNFLRVGVEANPPGLGADNPAGRRVSLGYVLGDPNHYDEDSAMRWFLDLELCHDEIGFEAGDVVTVYARRGGSVTTVEGQAYGFDTRYHPNAWGRMALNPFGTVPIWLNDGAPNPYPDGVILGTEFGRWTARGATVTISGTLRDNHIEALEAPGSSRTLVVMTNVGPWHALYIDNITVIRVVAPPCCDYYPECDCNEIPPEICDVCGNPIEDCECVITAEDVWRMSVCDTIQTLPLGVIAPAGIEAALAPHLLEAGDPTITVITTPDGTRGFTISDRTNAYFGLGIVLAELGLTANGNYRITVIGSGGDNPIALSAPEDPWPDFVTVNPGTGIWEISWAIDLAVLAATDPPSATIQLQSGTWEEHGGIFANFNVYEIVVEQLVAGTPGQPGPCGNYPCTCPPQQPAPPQPAPPQPPIWGGGGGLPATQPSRPSRPSDRPDADAPGLVTEPTIDITIEVSPEDIANALENGEDLVIDFDGAKIIIPNSVLASLVATYGSDGFAVSLTVTPGGFGQPGDTSGAFFNVDFGISVGGVTPAALSGPVSIAVSMADFDLTGINTNQIVAIGPEGQIIIGRFDEELMVFIFDTDVPLGSFTIVHMPGLIRLLVSIGSYVIFDLVNEVPFITMDVAPVIIDDRTLLPVRFLSYGLGATVGWNDATREVTLTIDGQSLTFAIGETAPGMDVPASIIGDRTMVPVRFISEFFGARVVWDEAERNFEIIK